MPTAYHFELSLISRSNGSIYLAKHDDLESGKNPTERDDGNHAFTKFWKDHLVALTNPGLYDLVVDSLVALALGEHNWPKSKTTNQINKWRNSMRTLLKDNPPNLVIVRDVPKSEAGYFGIHYRQSYLWKFICINESYINAWSASTKELDLVSYATLLDAAIDHELGHWIVTLASSIPWYQILIFSSYINKKC